MDWTLAALASLRPDGIQLTPGNLPAPGARALLERSPLPARTHEGFCFERRKAPVWGADGCVSASDSIHAPKLGVLDLWAWAERGQPRVLEVMPPGFHLGSGKEVRRAMAMGLPLAVDVSHVHLQLERGTMNLRDWAALRDYDGIDEVHVSRDDGHNDVHLPVGRDTFGLAWAKEREADGIPLVLECYMHRMTRAQAQEQLALLRS